jgi:nicotinamide riboside kinase
MYLIVLIAKLQYHITHITIFVCKKYNELISNYKYLVFTGPESSGKSTLSEWFSEIHTIPLITEYAREYLSDLDRPYSNKDLDIIAKGQLAKEIENLGEKHVVCDTDLLNIIIWYEVKYNLIPDWLLEWFQNDHNRIYFLCHPDIPWEYDPLRESPEDREILLSRHKNYLTKYHKKYINLTGDLASRKGKLELISTILHK